MSDARSRDVTALAVIFATSGVVHLLRPQTYEPLMPQFVPAHREVILVSGVAELLAAAGLMHPRTRSVAGWVSVGLLLVVYPGNLKMAADSRDSDRTVLKAVSWARLPLQLPMIRSAYRAATDR